MEVSKIKLRGLLEKLSKNENALRTSTVYGYCEAVPKVGSGFEILSKSLDPSADARYVRTSQVLTVSEVSPGVFEFETLNSTYRLTIEE